MSHFWVMCFFLMKLTSQIREMWIVIICIMGQMRILDGWKLNNFNIRGPLIVGAALLAITSLVHIFLEVLKIFDEKWIGRGGSVAWPPRSPDLTSPDYFLWGLVKERVMVVAPITLDDMKERIRRACTEITPQRLAEVRRSFHQRINKCPKST